MPEASELESSRRRASELESRIAAPGRRTRRLGCRGGLRSDRTIEYVSPSIERVLGHTPDEIPGVDFASLIHAADRRALEESGGSSLECLAIHKDGSERVIEAAFSQPFRSDEEQLTVIARGVTGRGQFAVQSAQPERFEALCRPSARWDLGPCPRGRLRRPRTKWGRHARRRH